MRLGVKTADHDVHDATVVLEHRVAMSSMGVRRGKAALSSGCKSHPATLQPEAAGAAMEVTKFHL